MPALAYTTIKDEDIPSRLFIDDIAVVMAQGGRRGDAWVISLYSVPGTLGHDRDSFKTIRTAENPDPDLAVDTILAWANDIAAKSGWKMGFEDLAYRYPEGHRGRFVAAQIVFNRRG